MDSVDDVDGMDGMDGIDEESHVIPTIKVVRAYLDSRRHTMYGRSWNIKKRETREQAAEWLAKEVDRINAIRNMAISSSYKLEDVVERARRLEP